MKMAALTMFTAEDDSRTAVLVTPWLGTPPPQSAASMISPPWVTVILAFMRVCASGGAYYLGVSNQHQLRAGTLGVK